MRSRHLLAAISASATFCTSCLPVPVYRHENVVAPVEGRVTDMVTNAPLADVKISWIDPPGHEAAAVRSDREGRFAVPAIQQYVRWKMIAMDPPGWHGTLRFELPGFAPSNIDFAYGPGSSRARPITRDVGLRRE